METMTFVPEMMNDEESIELFKIAKETLPWEKVSTGKRRNACFVGHPGIVPYNYSGQKHINHPMPDWLEPVMEAASMNTPDFWRYNGCLINLYETGDHTMGWHGDREDSLVDNSPVAILSVGSQRTLQIQNTEETKRIMMPMFPGSLLIMNGDLRYNWLHRVAGESDVRDSRISFTFRVLKKEGEV